MDIANLTKAAGPPAGIIAAAAWRLWFRRTARRRHEPGRYARRPHAGAGRPAADRARASSPRSRATATRSSSCVEEKTADWYSPSPGIVYPTLTYLEEAGYVTASTEGAKKLYAITAEGRAYLEANRDVVDAVLDRLTALGERINRWRRSERGERDNRRTLPALVEAAFDHLRETVGKRLENDADDEARLVEILARAAAELQQRR